MKNVKFQHTGCSLIAYLFTVITIIIPVNAHLILFLACERILRPRRRFRQATFAPFLNPLNNHLAAKTVNGRENKRRDGKTIR